MKWVEDPLWLFGILTHYKLNIFLKENYKNQSLVSQYRKVEDILQQLQ